MNVYRVVWQVVWAALGMVGIGVTFVLSPGALASLFLSFAILGALIALAVDTKNGKRPPQNRTTFVITSAVVGGATAGALVGLTVILGAGVLLLGLLVLVSSPYALSHSGRWLHSAPTPSTAQMEALARAFAYASPEYVPVQPSSELRRFTDAQLCTAWRASFRALQESSSATQMLETVEQRQRYLDELDRRNASGLTSWLASGARAAGNPLPYLVDDRAGRSAINWDELIRGQDW